jgi:hypothetical protein
MVSTVFYGWWIYPNVSQSIGGGMPLDATLVASETGRNKIANILGTELKNDNAYPVKVLLETSESFFIISKRDSMNRVCRIKKDLVSGVIHPPSK